ncbi:hypothetical protein MNV84_01096 [Leishmania braziliensis]|nr:hypothetical protein MNV84_01096 [Leishmania braziliensis]
MKKIYHIPTGNSAEDEQNNKRQAKRYRVYFIILAVLVALLLMLTTILTPMLLLQHHDSQLEQRHRDEERLAARDYATSFRDAILGAISAVYGVEGYVMGVMKTLPNLNDTPAQRVEGQYFSQFYRYAELVASAAPHISLFATAPGGVILQVYPLKEESPLKGWDLLNSSGSGTNHTDPAKGQRQDPYTVISTGMLDLTGPYKSSTLPALYGVNSYDEVNMWWVDLRQPIYNATSTALISNSTFWGFGIVVFSVDGLMQRYNFTKVMDSNEMAYVVYTMDNASSGSCTVIIASPIFNGETDCNTTSMQKFIKEATTRDVLSEKISWRISLKSTKRVNQFTPKVRNIIIISSIIGVFALFALCVCMIVRCTRVYDGTKHAPKMAPFAMLTIGPCRGEELWDLASDQMVEVTERLGHVLAQQMVRHGAYQIQQVHPLTTSYVTRSVAAAVQMAFSTIEELYSCPIDDPLRRLLGDEGRLLLSYAVHWCTDAAVRLEVMGSGLRYEGPDVVYSGRMWVFAGPNVVTVSPAALPSAKRMPHVKCKLFDSVFLRGVTTRQDLYVVTDTSNHHLKEAEAFAAEQVRRARQAQLQYTAGKETEPGSTLYTPQGRLFTYPRIGYENSDLDNDSLCLARTAADGASAASGNRISSHPIPFANSTGGSHVAAGGIRKGARKDERVGSCSVPASTPDGVLAGTGENGSESPSALSFVVPQRRMVRRPARKSKLANVVLGSPTSSSNVANVQTGNAVEMAAVNPQTPLLQHNATLSSSASTSGTNDISGNHSRSAIGAANNAQHPDVLPANPLVVVPPSTTMVAAAHGPGGGSDGSSPSTSSRNCESSVWRPGNIPPFVGDNPLAGSNTGPGPTGGRGAVSSPSVCATSHNSDGSAALQDNTSVLDNFSSDLLLRPVISSQSDLLLRAVFDRQAVALDLSYDSVRVLVYYFYSSYKILFRPLAAPELHNIYRRLVTAFGVPQQGILEHLAARCATRYLQRHEETQTRLWDQQHRLQAHIRSLSASTAVATSSVSDDETANISD